MCRPAAGDCDIEELCPGAGAPCPDDELLPSGTVCRPYADFCDVAETCTGSDAECPPDGVVPHKGRDPGVCAYELNERFCDGEGKGESHCRLFDGTPGVICDNDTNCDSRSCVNGICN